jgi:hypothetical protein
MFYGIIFFGGGGYSMESKNVFYIQKRIIKIMAGTKMTASCKKLFNKFNILPLASKFIMDNIKKCQINPDINSLITQYRYNHIPNTNFCNIKMEFIILE